MRSSEVVASSRWRHYLEGRKHYDSFAIPKQITANCNVTDGTKRKVKLVLSDGRSLNGFCTITSGEEMRLPNWLADDLRQSEWFECEFIGSETAPVAELHWS